jgi:putative redox protein
MNSLQRIRDSFDRMQHVFGKRPAVAQTTATMRARIIDGLHCEAREDEWQFAMDLPPDAGGTGAGPPPGVHGRAALAGCLAMSYSIELARAGIEARSIEVEVNADYDNRGMLGMDNVSPGYLAVRHTLYLECDAPRDAVQAAVDKALRNSPYLNIFSTAQPVSGEVVFGPRPQA